MQKVPIARPPPDGAGSPAVEPIKTTPAATSEEAKPGPEHYSELRHSLRRGARALQRPAVARCGTSTPGGLVAAHAGHGGAVSWSGVHLCHSAHSCPVCAAAIARGRAAELADVGGEHLAAGGQTWMASLTLRHGPQHDLTDLCDVLSLAWRHFSSGRWGQAWKQRLGVEGAARGWEATWGRQSGWHPHFHVALFLTPALQPCPEHLAAAKSALAKNEAAANALILKVSKLERSAAKWLRRNLPERSSQQQAKAEVLRGRLALAEKRCDDAGRLVMALCGSREDLQSELSVRWCRSVVHACEALEIRTITEDDTAPEVAAERFRGIEPDTAHGFKLTRASVAEYVAKMGFEVAGVGKVGRNFSDSERFGPWELLFAGVTQRGELEAAWREYSAATFGRRSLTWSRGLRMRDTTDEELCQRYMREAPVVGYVEGRAYVAAESEGNAWWLAKQIHADVSIADCWLREHGFAAVVMALAEPPTPAPRYTPLGARRGASDRRIADALSSKRASEARIATWSAVGGVSEAAAALRKSSRVLDEHARLERGEHIRAELDHRGEWVPLPKGASPRTAPYEPAPEELPPDY